MTLQEGDWCEPPPERILKALDRVDAMPSDLRLCVHEFGLTIVDACLGAGVKQPNRIRQLIHEIWSGTRSPWRQTRQRGASGLMSKLDCLLMNSGAEINAYTLVRVLYLGGYTIVPLTPWACMTNASMATVSDHDIKCTKSEKHSRRLRAAIQAAIKYAWPHLES
jgi:hypothetical protein